MRKFSTLVESIWSDIQDRSTGNVVRKEDDVNLLDYDTFGEYIRRIYIPKNDKCTIFCASEIRVPVIWELDYMTTRI